MSAGDCHFHGEARARPHRINTSSRTSIGPASAGLLLDHAAPPLAQRLAVATPPESTARRRALGKISGSCQYRSSKINSPSSRTMETIVRLPLMHAQSDKRMRQESAATLASRGAGAAQHFYRQPTVMAPRSRSRRGLHCACGHALASGRPSTGRDGARGGEG
jgi:hypothetical protein